MDTVTDFVQTLNGNQQISKYMIAGESKVTSTVYHNYFNPISAETVFRRHNFILLTARHKCIGFKRMLRSSVNGSS